MEKRNIVNSNLDLFENQYIVFRIHRLKPYSTKIIGIFKNNSEAYNYVKKRTGNRLKFEIHILKDDGTF